MTKNVLLCGVGGQGTVLASRLIALAAMEKGMEARGCGNHWNGTERRQCGSAMCGSGRKSTPP